MQNKSVELKSIKSFFVGGTLTPCLQKPQTERSVLPGYSTRSVDTSGRCSIGQMYVQEYLLSQPRCNTPILLWHGGGMTGAQWEATADGRQGWLFSLLARAFNVLLCDAAERGRASWNPAVLNTERPDQTYPVLRTAEEAWSVFRIGQVQYKDSIQPDFEPFPNQLFPTLHFQDFTRFFVPRWFAHESIERDAYSSLLDQLDGAIIIAHSQGCGHALHLAQRHNKKIRAVVAIEPTGVPSQISSDLPPHLAVWCDHFEFSPLWREYRSHAEAYWKEGVSQGMMMDTLDLPHSGILGNSHFPMQDKNSDFVLGLIIEWLSKH